MLMVEVCVKIKPLRILNGFNSTFSIGVRTLSFQWLYVKNQLLYFCILLYSFSWKEKVTIRISKVLLYVYLLLLHNFCWTNYITYRIGMKWKGQKAFTLLTLEGYTHPFSINTYATSRHSSRSCFCMFFQSKILEIAWR
jgi:hypothetical protein